MDKIKTKGLSRQILSCAGSHLFIALVTSAFGFGAFWWFLTQSNWKEIFSIICTVIYIIVLFLKGQKIALHDKKSYSDETPFWFKGILLAIGPILITFIIWLLYRMTWVYMAIDNNISGYTGIIYNISFILWTFPFNGLICPFQGGIFWYGHIIIYVVPLISLFFGYAAGYKGINIYEKILPLMYEKKKKN